MYMYNQLGQRTSSLAGDCKFFSV